MLREAVPVTVSAAEMVALPRARLWTRSCAETVAMVVSDEVQVTALVRSTLLPSAYKPVALSWIAVPL
jgi:hypothetical protein